MVSVVSVLGIIDLGNRSDSNTVKIPFEPLKPTLCYVMLDVLRTSIACSIPCV